VHDIDHRKEPNLATTADPSNRMRDCFLYGAAGASVACQPARCSFWEVGAGRCVVEHLGLREDLEDKPELVRWLLAVRSELSSSRLELPSEPLPPYNLLPLPGLRP
jgi:hypothetical protein